MKLIFKILFALLPLFTQGQTISNHLLAWNRDVQGQLSGIWVHYNSTPYSYLSSKAGYSDTGSFQTGSNVIGVSTITSSVPTNNANTGLGYDDNTDRFCTKAEDSGDSYFFTRDAFVTSAAAAAGTLPTFDEIVNQTGQQGVTIDPINNLIYEIRSTVTSVASTDFSGSTVETFTAPSPAQGSMIFYDPVTRNLQFSADGPAPIYFIRKIASVWTHVFTSWYQNNEGAGNDYVFDKIVGNGTDGRIREQDQFSGLNVVLHPYPTAGMESVQEGFLVDVKDGTFWLNSDQRRHGGITDGDRTWHVDPRGLYRQWYRTPDMDTWTDLWNLNGNTTNGRLNGQRLIGTNFSIGPVVDYASHTGQQTIGNWHVPDGESCILEFRGSSSAPTTTPQASKDYHTLALYDANDTNDGWGATSPGSWQSTPTTDRYMQVRVRPQAYVPPVAGWTPANLGSKLIAWFTCKKNGGDLANEFQAMYVDWSNTQRITKMINMVNPSNSLDQGTNTQRPLWDNTDACVDLVGSNRNLIPTDQSGFLSLLGTDVEVHVNGRKPSATSNSYYLSAAVTSTNNNQIRLQHTGSGATPANFNSIRYVDNSGTINLMGFTDTSSGTFRLISYVTGGSANAIYLNNVSQTMTVNTGANTGQSWNLVAGVANAVRVGRVQASTSAQGETDIRDIIITQHLTSQERQLLVDYLTNEGRL